MYTCELFQRITDRETARECMDPFCQCTVCDASTMSHPSRGFEHLHQKLFYCLIREVATPEVVTTSYCEMVTRQLDTGQLGTGQLGTGHLDTGQLDTRTTRHPIGIILYRIKGRIKSRQKFAFLSEMSLFYIFIRHDFTRYSG